jgi:glycerol-3-phosphate acyltransferase PlsY
VFVVFALVFGYLCGSVPFGLLLTRAAGTADLRSIGSGNIGATNVLRTGRKDLAALTLLADALKATLAILVVAYIVPPSVSQVPMAAAAIGAFLGHTFPVWLRFHGGKGVATFLGCLLALSPWAALVFAIVWLAVAALSRFSSLAALLASAATPWFLAIIGQPFLACVMGGLAVLLWIKHRANILRLAAASEGKIGQSG